MKDIVESWEVFLLMKLLQVLTVKDIVESWDVTFVNEANASCDNEG